MPHQQILRPRFYPIKNLEMFSTAELYAKAKYIDYCGNITENNVESDEETFKASIFNPYTRKRIPMVSGDNGTLELTFNTGQYTAVDTSLKSASSSVGFNYFALLGHQMKQADCGFKIYGRQFVDADTGAISDIKVPLDMTPLLNCETVADNNGDDWIVGTSGDFDAQAVTGVIGDDLDVTDALTGGYSDGSCIVEVDPNSTSYGAARFFTVVFKPWTSAGFGRNYLQIGSFAWGRYYDMPHSPDLSYSMKIAHDGVKNKKTVGGSTVTNIQYTRAPLIGGQYEGFGREGSSYGTAWPSGRRSWKMNFSAIKAGWESNYNDETGYMFPGTIHSNTE